MILFSPRCLDPSPHFSDSPVQSEAWETKDPAVISSNPKWKPCPSPVLRESTIPYKIQPYGPISPGSFVRILRSTPKCCYIKEKSALAGASFSGSGARTVWLDFLAPHAYFINTLISTFGGNYLDFPLPFSFTSSSGSTSACELKLSCQLLPTVKSEINL